MKSKAVEESEEEDEKQRTKTDKISNELALKHACAVSEHKWCWVRDDGQHIGLEKQDLSSWAIWIVSRFCG